MKDTTATGYAALLGLLLALGLLACSADSDDGGKGGNNPGGTAGSGVGSGVAGNGGVAGSGGLAGNGSAGSLGGAGLGGNTCAQGTANASPVTPTVWLVLDGSGSMNENFGGPSRWEALRSALMDPGGVVETLAQGVRFGMVLYSGGGGSFGGGGCIPFQYINASCGCQFGLEAACCEPGCGYVPPPEPDPATCTDLVIVDPAIDNYAALDAQMPAEEPGGWTPTDKALDHVVANLPVIQQDILDGESGPVFVVLATDGQPNDMCSDGGGFGGGGGNVEQRVIDVTTSGAQMGMKMFVISLAGGDQDLQAHLEQVAQAGGTGQAPFVPSTKDDLVATLQSIIGGATCQITLDGKVTAGQECNGQVTINDQPIDCASDNGWRLTDERTVQLTGSACDSFLTMQSQVRATFPCTVFTPD